MARRGSGRPAAARAPAAKASDFSELSGIADYLIDVAEYRALGALGAGTFGKVWKGESRVTGWTVAVKELLADTLQGRDLAFYQREVQILVRCKDPFLLDFIGFTLSPPYSIVTSFMPCGSLWDAVHNRAFRLNAGQKTNIAMGIAHGMAYLHRHKVVHRDLKSPNILLDERLLPKVADFGLGRIMTECEAAQQMTGNLGTPIWMAPELLMDTPYGPPVDVYAYAMILYEMYTERVPFGGLDRMRIFKAVVEDGERPELPHPDTALARLIQQCWDADPAQRPTFEQIYAQFAAFSVSFPDTKPEGTAILAHEVADDELIVDNAVVDLANEINEMLALRRAPRDPADLQDQLTQAAAAGDVYAMSMLLTAHVHVISVNGRDAAGVPPLHAAVRAGSLVAVEFLTRIEQADANVRDAEQNTPLIAAAKYGQPRILGYLAQCARVDVNLQNAYGWTALHVVGLLDPGWHAPMLAALALAKDVRADLEDWDGKRPFAGHQQAIDEFAALQARASGKKY
jgi:serine/threonine protein kinase